MRMLRQPVDGRSELSEPMLSQCDVEALGFMFAWALEGGEPYPPGERPYSCSLD
jgi:hypothetical protein